MRIDDVTLKSMQFLVDIFDTISVPTKNLTIQNGVHILPSKSTRSMHMARILSGL